MPLINSLSLLSPIFVCLFFALLFATASSYERKPKSILFLFMFFTAIVHVYAFSVQKGISLFAAYIDGFFAASYLSLTPFFYLYILSLTSENFRLKNQLVHFVPSLIFLLIITVLHLLLSDNQKVYYITEHMVGNFSENRLMLTIYFFSRAKAYVFATQTVIYFILSVKKLSKHKQTINNMFTRNNDMKLDWLYIFSIIYFFGSVNGIIVILVPLKEVLFNDIFFNTSLIFFAISYYFYGLLGVRQKPIMRIIKDLDSSLEINSEPAKKPHELLQQINNYVLNNELFLNPELKIWDLANEVNSNRTYVSKVINEETGMNFANYINSFRIDKACCYLSIKDKEYLINDLVALCGFNSFSSFNRAFRFHTGITTSEYKKNITIEQS